MLTSLGQRKNCPVCREGCLHARVGEQAVAYRGQPIQTAFHYWVCDACCAEQADSGMLRQNKRLMQAAIARIQPRRDDPCSTI